MIDARALVHRVEGLIDPLDGDDAGMLEALDAFSAEVLPSRRLAELSASGELPAAELSALARGPLGAALTPADQGGSLDWSRAMRLTARLAAYDVGLTLCLGGTVLGALPVLVAGDAAQRARFFGAFRAGGMAALALSEWEHGSDLAASEVTAEPLDDAGAPTSAALATQFRLDGTKRPINNGSTAAMVTVLARTGGRDAFGLSLFLLGRDQPGLLPCPQVAWQGYRGMDLSGVRLDRALVPRAALLGKVGEGFAHTRRTLAISRSGVSAMALGPAASALAMAAAHSRERVLYGSPVGALGGVEALLGRAFSRFVAAVALVRRAARSVGRWAEPARPLSCAAKLMSPTLCEEVVSAAGTLLGARSLLDDHPFAPVRRNAPVFAIFDGSSQLQLDELWRYAITWPEPGSLGKGAALAWLRALRGPGPARFDPGATDGGELRAASPPAMLHALADEIPEVPLGLLAEAAGALGGCGAGIREAPQEVKFVYALAAARLYTITALAEAAALAGEGRGVLVAALAAFLADDCGPLAASLAELAGAGMAGLDGVGARLVASARDGVAARRAAGRALAALTSPGAR
jgi:alkylation response protein AidB-like acyl-CoA dehydrogenase